MRRAAPFPGRLRLPRAAWPLALAACAACAGEGVRIDAGVKPERIYYGESAVYVLQASNVKEIEKAELPGLEEDFVVEGPRVQYSREQVNFSKISEIARLTYQLTPRRSGKFELPAPKVTIGGKVYLGPKTTLDVLEPERQDAVLMSLEAQPRRVYPGQPFGVTLRIAMKPLPGGDPREPITLLPSVELRIPWLKEPPSGVTLLTDVKALLGGLLTRGRGEAARGFKLEDWQVGGGFSFFEQSAVVRPEAKREKRAGLDGKEHEYFVYEIAARFKGEKPGRYEFGPDVLQGNFIVGAQGRRYEIKRFPVVAGPASVEVVDVATLAHPPDFTGAIGGYTVSAAANPLELRVGDPLTLELTVKAAPGSIGWERVGAPNLKHQADLARDFVLLDEEPVGEVLGETKRFQYALRPKRAGVSVPPIAFRYFDPQSERFVQVQTEPIALKVTETAGLGAGDVMTSRRGDAETAQVKRSEGGIHQNVTDLGALGDRRADPRVFAAYPFALALCYAGLAAYVERKRRRATDVAWQRRQRALAEARKALQAARESGPGAPGRARAALLGLVADHCNLAAAGLTPRDAAAALHARGVPEVLRGELAALLERLETAAFGGGAGLDEGLLANAEDLAKRLDAEARR